MQIDINSKSVRVMADRIAKAHEDITKPKALEILSSGFGYKNFDTLSGVLKQSEPAATQPQDLPVVPEFTPFTLVIDAFACDEYGDGPDYAEATITPEFLEEMLRRVATCASAGIRAAHFNEDDGVWHDPQDELRMRGTDLVIMPSRGALAEASFFFQGHRKHADYNCETRAIDIKDLLACIGNAGELPMGFARERGVLFYDGGSALVSDLVESYFEDKDDRPKEGDEVWWFDPDNDISSGVYTVTDADHPEIVSLENQAGGCVEALASEMVRIDRDAVAEWVGLRYRVNFDAEPEDRKIEWIGRWAQAQRETE